MSHRSPAALLRALRACRAHGARLGRRRVRLTLTMPLALFHEFVGWPPRQGTRPPRRRVPRGKKPGA